MDAVAEVRAFNRLYTRRIGALREGLLGTRHPLPDARVLYELGQVDAAEVRDLRVELELDAGFLSRILTRLERDGLVARATSAADARRQTVRLTAAGRRAFAELDRRSAADNGELAARLGPAGLDALRTVRATLDRPEAVELRGPEPGDLGWIVQRHGALYAQEHGWDQRFEALVAQVIAAYAPERDRFWIAAAHGTAVGCVMYVADDAQTARLRLLLVEPHARGLGLGGRLVDAVLAHARERGHTRVVLWTNDVLTGARSLYDRRGFTLCDERRHADFGPPMTGQTLQLSL
jgi:DNA-binding MarR family transcriptional regulator/N-acetylglutamate synthase-like GNAT family acetyltransferase